VELFRILGDENRLVVENLAGAGMAEPVILTFERVIDATILNDRIVAGGFFAVWADHFFLVLLFWGETTSAHPSPACICLTRGAKFDGCCMRQT
jgi:hypothetical protein